MKTSFFTIWKKINLFIFQSVFMWSIGYFSIVFEAFKKEGRVVVFNILVKSSLAHYAILSKQCVTILHIIGRALINKQLIYLIQYGISQKNIHSSTWRLKRFIAIVGASLEANQSWMTLIRFANYFHKFICRLHHLWEFFRGIFRPKNMHVHGAIKVYMKLSLSI